MEIHKQLDRHNYVDHAYLTRIRPVNEYIFLVNVKHGGEYELSVSVSDVRKDKPDFNIMPSKSSTAKECAHDFATTHWAFLKECVLLMEQCTHYEPAVQTVEKARLWDAHTASLQAVNHATGKNSDIRIFEVQAGDGTLAWVAATTIWKATLEYMDRYEVFCMEDEIKEVFELPREKWHDYFVFGKKSNIPFDSYIKRLRIFPQVFCIAKPEKKGKRKKSEIDINPL